MYLNIETVLVLLYIIPACWYSVNWPLCYIYTIL